MLSLRSNIFASVAVVAASIGGGFSVLGAAPPPASHSANEIRLLEGLSVTAEPDSVRVVLKLDGTVNYRAGYLSNPSRFYFDLLNTHISPAVRKRQFDVESPLGSQLRLAHNGSGVARIVVTLDSSVFHIVSTVADPPEIIIDLVRQTRRMEITKSAPPELSEAGAKPQMRTPVAAAPPVMAVLPNSPSLETGGGSLWPRYIDQPHIPPPPQEKLLATAGSPAPLITPVLPVAPRPVESVPEGNTLRIPKVTRAPKLADFLTHTPREAEARVSDFRQRSPGDGTPATQPTSAFLSYDEHNLYVVFECTDEASKIRAHMSKRDDIGDDDQVAVYLDTFHDGQRAYVFTANPYGIQNDAVMTEGGGTDNKFDTLWYTEAKIIDNGYVVWIAIPFKSVRFTGQDIQNWGIALSRSLVRRNEGSIWPFISKKRERFIKYFAGMEGLNEISPGRNIQLIPYVNAARAQTLAPRGLVGDHDIRGGVDGKAVFRNALTLDFTVNPDFSQVESDDPQVTINQRYEVYFPEKRPFFLENSAYFQTPFNLFFSRRIVDPEFGARLTGKVGDWALGFMGTDDRATGQRQASGSPYFGDRSKIGIFRIQREFKNQSHIGAFATSNDFGSSWNRVAAVDARINLNPNWYVSGQLVKSFDRQLNGTETSGTAAKADLSYVDRHLSYAGDYTDLTPDFKAPLGFIRRVDLRQTTQYIGYFWQPEDRKVLSYGPAISYLTDWDHKGQLQDWSVNADFGIDFSGPFGFHATRYDAFERYIGKGYRDTRSGFSFYANTIRWLSVYGGYGQGTGINYTPAEGIDPFRAASTDANFGLTFRPSPSLTFTQYYYYTHLGTRTNTLPVGAQPGSLFNNHLLRWKFNYQFSKALSVRTIVDYYALLPNPSLFNSDKYKQLTGDILFTYLINPGTALYVGYNNRYENVLIDPSIPPALRRVAAINDLTSRQFFIKLSYLLRF